MRIFSIMLVGIVVSSASAHAQWSDPISNSLARHHVCGKITSLNITHPSNSFTVKLESGTFSKSEQEFVVSVQNRQAPANSHRCDKNAGEFFDYMQASAIEAHQAGRVYCVEQTDQSNTLSFAGEPKDYDAWVQPNEGGTCG